MASSYYVQSLKIPALHTDESRITPSGSENHKYPNMNEQVTCVSVCLIITTYNLLQ